MMRTSVAIATLLAAIAVLLCTPLPGRTSGELDGNVYVVRSGDTLSGIAARFLGDAKRWPEILRANPQVTDGQRIFPGDTLTLPIPEPEPIAISTGAPEAPPAEAYEPLPVSAPLAEEAAVEAEPPMPALPVEVVRPLPVVSQATYRATGYITAELPRTAIVAAFDSKSLLAEGDEVVIGSPAEEGATFTVVRPTRRVYHPRSGEYLGWVIRILGRAEVTCRGEGASRAVLSQTNDAVHVGDLVVPFDPDDVLEDDLLREKRTVFCLRDADEGYIVAAQDGRITVGGGDIVFLDRGSREGVKPGDQFVAYRRIAPEGIQVVGQVQILKVGERTSSGLVINSIRELAVADPVQAWEPPGDASGS